MAKVCHECTKPFQAAVGIVNVFVVSSRQFPFYGDEALTRALPVQIEIH